MPETLSVVYLHGFASSPRSRKALFFSERLAERGIRVQVPDLAEADFEHLTITSQLALVERTIGDEPRVLIGSSLGGYLAALYAASHPAIARALLLAPAFGFAQLWEAELGPDKLARWQSEGSLPVFHYGEGRELPLGYSFLADAVSYPPFPPMQQPALLVHGIEDAVVPVEQSLAFVRFHPQSRLIRLSSGHELTDVLEDIWSQSAGFLLGEVPL